MDDHAAVLEKKKWKKEKKTGNFPISTGTGPGGAETRGADLARGRTEEKKDSLS